MSQSQQQKDIFAYDADTIAVSVRNRDSMSTQPGELVLEACPRDSGEDSILEVEQRSGTHKDIYPESKSSESGPFTPESLSDRTVRVPRDDGSDDTVPVSAAREWAEKPLWKIWVAEIICIVFGFSALSTIIAVLASFDQKQLPNWPLKITLNTVLAFLAIIAKAAFMVPVSASISQTQWSWFSRERPLHDFHLMDQASRGPLGSAKLAFQVRHRHFVTLGAVLTIVSVLTSPITQLAIDYPLRQVTGPGDTRVPALRALDHTADYSAFGLNGAILQATTPDSHDGYTRRIIPPGAVCPTGNCTFEIYNSLGVCMQMVNVTPQLIIHQEHVPGSHLFANNTLWNVSIPGGDVELVHQSRLAAKLGMLNGRHSLAFQDQPNLIQSRVASFVLIYTATAIQDEAHKQEILNAQDPETIIGLFRDIRHEAFEIIFHLCVQTYNTTVDRGNELTKMVHSTVQPLPGLDPDLYLNISCDPIVESEVVEEAVVLCQDHTQNSNRTIQFQDPSNEAETFRADYKSMDILNNELWWTLSGSFRDTLQEDRGGASLYFSGTSAIWNLLQFLFIRPESVVDDHRVQEQLYNLYYNIAAGISHRLRDASDKRAIESAFNVTGQAWVQESYVNITWGWITYLAVELVLATVFLSLTIYTQTIARRSEDPASAGLMFHDYKDVAVAPLLALSTECRHVVGGGLQGRDEMEKMAKRILVKFQGNKVVVAGTLDGKRDEV